eukprot:SAG25_NODE_10825_length_322_cov_0.538117_1_plen_30_part_01
MGRVCCWKNPGRQEVRRCFNLYEVKWKGYD